MPAIHDILEEFDYPPSKQEFINYLKDLSIPPKGKKYLLHQYCEEFNCEYTQADVEQIYPQENG